MYQQLLTMFPAGELVMIAGFCALLTAFAAGAVLTPWMIALSWRWRAVDRPDGLLKRHHRATATLGGAPFLLAVLLTVGVIYLAYQPLPAASLRAMGWTRSLWGMALAAVIMFLVGLHDDVFQVAPRAKLAFQILAAMTVVGAGLVVRRCLFFDVFEVRLGALAAPFTLFWLVGSCNAFNFIDGMDGLASSIGAVIAAALGVLGLMNGAYAAAMVAWAISGALLGVLLFNLKPALIFLGDSGSQVVGLSLGALAIAIGTHNGTFALPAMGIILSVPIIDAFLAVLRRFSHFRSAALGDHRHIHHCLLAQGCGVNRSLAIVVAAVAVTCGFGIMWTRTAGVAVGVSALTLVVVELWVGARLGCLDLAPLRMRFGLLWGRADQRIANSATRVKGELAALWEQMEPLFEQLNLNRAVLTLESSGADSGEDAETFRWTRSEEMLLALGGSLWTKRFELDDDGRRVAVLRLEATGSCDDEERMDQLLKQIEDNMSVLRRKRQEKALKDKESIEVA